MLSTCKYNPVYVKLNLVSYPLNRITPELERTLEVLGLKYLPDFPMETNFKDWKKFFTRLLKKFKEITYPLAFFLLSPLRSDNSTVLTGLSVIEYF